LALLDKDVTMAVEQRETTVASGTETLPAGAAETPPYAPELSYRAFLDPRVVDGAEDGGGRKGEDKRRSRVARALGRALDALP